jgi:hypothetical protein
MERRPPSAPRAEPRGNNEYPSDGGVIEELEISGRALELEFESDRIVGERAAFPVLNQSWSGDQ